MAKERSEATGAATRERSERGAGGALIRPLEGAVVSLLMSEAKYKGALRQFLRAEGEAKQGGFCV